MSRNQLENEILTTFVKAPQFKVIIEASITLITIGVISEQEKQIRKIPDYIPAFCLKIKRLHEFYYLLTLDGLVLNITTQWKPLDIVPYFVVKFVIEEVIPKHYRKNLEIGFFDELQDSLETHLGQ